MTRGVMFSAEDFRQYYYCPRIIYFRYVSRIQPRQTYKMKKGQEYHQRKVRRKTQSQKGNLTINYNVFLEDTDLGICALFDAIAFKGEKECYPIEYKTGKIHDTIPKHHQIQLLAQAIILENTFNREVKQVEIRYKGEKRFVQPISYQEMEKVLQLHHEMLLLVQDEVLPKPTTIPQKCVDCEFWLHCRRC
ncbi:MAG: CRISPR-associated protein Cas4 [Asgard group archaeon]|nr:CRISPR-associated protein Cas4 [Asgard group archaeon]